MEILSSANGKDTPDVVLALPDSPCPQQRCCRWDDGTVTPTRPRTLPRHPYPYPDPPSDMYTTYEVIWGQLVVLTDNLNEAKLFGAVKWMGWAAQTKNRSVCILLLP